MTIKPIRRLIIDDETEEVKEVIEVTSTIIEDPIKVFNVDTITSTLMSAIVTFHLLHFQTTKYSIHKTLDEFYTELTKLSDEIIETLLGVENTRLDSDIIVTSSPFIHQDVTQATLDHLQVLYDFSKDLIDYCKNRNYEDVLGSATGLQQLINSTKYKLTLW